MAERADWELTVHVKPSQCHPGSRGAKNYAHIERASGGEFVSGRLRVPEGRTLCKKPHGWWERPSEGDDEVCPECLARAMRHGIAAALALAAPSSVSESEAS